MEAAAATAAAATSAPMTRIIAPFATRFSVAGPNCWPTFALCTTTIQGARPIMREWPGIVVAVVVSDPTRLVTTASTAAVAAVVQQLVVEMAVASPLLLWLEDVRGWYMGPAVGTVPRLQPLMMLLLAVSAAEAMQSSSNNGAVVVVVERA